MAAFVAMAAVLGFSGFLWFGLYLIERFSANRLDKQIANTIIDNLNKQNKKRDKIGEERAKTKNYLIEKSIVSDSVSIDKLRSYSKSKIKSDKPKGHKAK